MTAIAALSRQTRIAARPEDGVATMHARLMILMLLFLGVTVAIVGKIGWMAVVSDRDTGVAISNALTPARADIVDRNGVPLARMIQGWAIGVHPAKVIGDKAELARALARLMPERSAAWYHRVLLSKKRYVYLRRRALPDLVREVNALGEPAISLTREPERLYPQGALGAHVLGWLDNDGRPQSGLELVLNQRLTDPARLADPVALSIDSRVQAALETELTNAVVKHSAVGASGIVLDVRTGEVIAMTSLPTFNPNSNIAASEHPEAMRNQATLSVFELGSTFKPITIAGAIEAGVVTSMTKRYDATAPLPIGRFRIRDDHPQNRWLNVPEMLVHSSNIVTARIADEMGADRMAAHMRKMGFDRAANLELGARGKPLWPRDWGRSTTMTVGYGHGVAVTPLHLANAYAALVNGGILRDATLMKANGARPGRRVISAETSALMLPLIRLIVTDGTGGKADAEGFRVGGKTGTADKAAVGGYNRRSRVSTFAAAFPMDDPRYVIVAMMDEPKGTADTGGYATAGMVAAPIVGKVVARIGPLLGVYPSDKAEPQVDAMRELLWKPRKKKKEA